MSGMKMARASEQDLSAAMQIAQIIDSLERGYMPFDDDDEITTRFDADDPQQCQKALQALLQAAERGRLMRVVGGMFTLLDPRNKVLDPQADAIELHPEHQMNAAAAVRYHWATALEENAKLVHAIVLCLGGNQADIDARVDVYRTSPPPQDQSDSVELQARKNEAQDELDQIYEVFGFSKEGRERHFLLENIRNVFRRSRCLSAIERVMTVTIPPDPSEGEDSPGEEKLLRWGADPEGYEAHFRQALGEYLHHAAASLGTAISSLASFQGQAPTKILSEPKS